MAQAEVPPVEDAPDWFKAALAVPFTDEVVEVDGAPVHFLAWGQRGRRGLVFVHGGGANAHWWTHVAGRFADDFRVLAIDLSGHGDSAWRDDYSLEGWTDEVMAVAEAGGIEGPPVIVGHSMGGFVTIATAARFGDRVTGAIVCDSPVTEPDPEVAAFALKQAFGKQRTYESIEEAVPRFRTIPSQEHYLPYVMDHVARRSLRQVPPEEDEDGVGGWRWKFDRGIFAPFGHSMRGIALPYLPEVRSRFALLRSEHGLVTQDIGEAMYEALGRVATVVELPLAGHHPMLDVPLILLTAIRTLLADWDHSRPLRR
jgi:pimeloyl-ACP methyl ester carboxylesterase